MHIIYIYYQSISFQPVLWFMYTMFLLIYGLLALKAN